MSVGIQPPPEDAPGEQFLSDEERYRDSRENPHGTETKRGIIGYHNELVDYGREINLQPGDNEAEAMRRTIFYSLINDLLAKNSSLTVRLLDLGCGNGQFLRELKQLFGDRIEVYGVTARAYNRDGRAIMEESEEKAYIEAERKNDVNIEIRNMSDLGNFSDDFFDLVVSAEGINYAGDPLQVIEQSARVLKRGGTIIAGPVAAKIQGLQFPLAGNSLLDFKLGAGGIRLTGEVQKTPLKDDVICFTTEGAFKKPNLRFSHSAKFKNGAVYGLSD